MSSKDFKARTMGKIKKQIWTIDCETDPFDGESVIEPFIWGAYNGAIYKESGKIGDILDFITDNGGGIIYAHNGGKFDFYFFMDLIPVESDILVINGRLAKFTIGELEFRDSYCILPVPLAAFNKDDFDYSLLTKQNRVKPENKIKISAYLKSDCINLYAPIIEFIDSYGDSITVAGAALKFFNKLTKTPRPKTSLNFFNKFSEFYFGGRVECFTSGIVENELIVIDINSAYPHVMSELHHPYGDRYTLSGYLPKTDNYIRLSFITLKCASLGCFPLRGKTNLQFPNDGLVREFLITGHEYLAARDCGLLKDVEIDSVITFSDSINFKPYVDHFSALKITAKEEGNAAQYIFSKLFLNGLYGKYGSNFSKYSKFHVIHAKSVNYYQTKLKADFVSELTDETVIVKTDLEEEEMRFLNVATAASVTGAVRANLIRAKAECVGVHYMDTDSIVCEAFSEKLEIHPTKLGAWDVEAIATKGAFAGKKLYSLILREDYATEKNGGSKNASKGAKLSSDEIFRVARGETVEYANLAPTIGMKGLKYISRNIRKTI